MLHKLQITGLSLKPWRVKVISFQRKCFTSQASVATELEGLQGGKIIQPKRKRPFYDIRGKCLGIRREEQSVWERRAPVAPNHVKNLVKKGCRVLVQPSNRRAYPMQVRIIRRKN
jgi:hypothetical protein